MSLRNFYNLRHLRIRHILRRPISLRSRRGADGTVANGHDSTLFHIPEQLRLLKAGMQLRACLKIAFPQTVTHILQKAIFKHALSLRSAESGMHKAFLMNRSGTCSESLLAV